MKVPVLATCVMLVALTILVSLGMWQLKRLAWKEQILADITAIENADHGASLDLTSNADGTYGMRAGRVEGLVLLQTIKLQQGANAVEYSFIQLKDKSVLPVRGKAKSIMAGYIRDAARPNRFVPDNKPPTWFWLDAKALSTYLGKTVIAAEFIPWSKQDGPLPRPNNNHLQYAIFWFAMGAIMIVIYILRFFGKGQS